MTRSYALWLSSLAVVIISPISAATFTVNYNDGASEGFNDPGAPHAQSTADGNPGETLGEQRRWAFEKALEFWGHRLQSGLIVKVNAEMNDLTCDSTSAVLGSAGTTTVHRDWSPAAGGSTPAFSSTWYGQALANRIANKDNCASPGCGLTDEDIGATFNKHIDESTSCLGSNVWYYAMGDAPAGTTSFFKTVLHEIGHGVNFQTFVDETDGTRLSGFDDVYMQFLEDHSLGSAWPNMTDQQREDSAIDTNDLHWTGANVLAVTGSLSDGTSGGHVEMYAPSPLEPGSSVSHWDIDVDDGSGNSELMEPSATGTEKLTVTDEMLEDMGWNDFDPNNCTFAADRRTISGPWSGTNAHTACVSITFDGAVINSGSTSGEAGQQIILQNNFNVKTGATFAVSTDPSIGL